MARVLVTDAEQRSSLAAIRSLGRARHDVMGCSSDARPLGGGSRYCRACFRVPEPSANPRGFIEAVARIVDDEDVEAVLPMTDVSAPLVLSLRRSHRKVVIPFPEMEDYEAASDKALLMRVAEEAGVPVPRQVVLREPGCIEDAVLDEIGFPLVLKPSHSAVTTGNGRMKFAVTIVTQKDRLNDMLAAYPKDAYPLLVQQRVIGPGLGVFLLAWEGKTLAAFAHRRIREKPPTGGVSVYRESVAVSSDLREYSELLLKRFHWRGVAMVEFKQDARTGTPYLMEINGRFWGSLQLAIDSGVDFPKMLLCVALGEACEPARGFTEGVRCRWLWGDVDHLLWMLKTPRTDLRAHPNLPGRLAALGRFLIPWRPGDHFEVLRLTDPGPFLRETANWFRDLR